MLMVSGRREGALAIPSPGIGLPLNELSTPQRRNDYPIAGFEARGHISPLTPSFGRRFPRCTRARRRRAPMQGLILNESSFALYLISKGHGACRRECRAPGSPGFRATGNQRSVHAVCKCQNKLAISGHEVCSKTEKVCSKGPEATISKHEVCRGPAKVRTECFQAL